MSADRTFADFAASLTNADTGLRFELEPWQLAMMEALERGDRPLDHGEIALASRRAGRRLRAAFVLASAVLGGHDVIIARPERDELEYRFGDVSDVTHLAAQLLERYAEVTGADVALARKRLQRARKEPDSDRGRASA